MAVDAQLRATVNNILLGARQRRQWGYGRRGRRGNQQVAGKDEVMAGDVAAALNMRQCGSVVMGRRQGMTKWMGDTVHKQDGKCRQTGKEVDFPLEGSINAGGVVRGKGKYLRENKQQILGLDQSLTKVGTPPPHNSVTLHGLVYGKQQQQTV